MRGIRSADKGSVHQYCQIEIRRVRTPQAISERPRYFGASGNGAPERRYLLQALEELDDREAEADERNRGSYPRHHGALHAEAGSKPSEMGVRGYPYFESALRLWQLSWVRHSWRSCQFSRAAAARRHPRSMRVLRPRSTTYGTNGKHHSDDDRFDRIKCLEHNELIDNVHDDPRRMILAMALRASRSRAMRCSGLATQLWRTESARLAHPASCKIAATAAISGWRTKRNDSGPSGRSIRWCQMR